MSSSTMIDSTTFYEEYKAIPVNLGKHLHCDRPDALALDFRPVSYPASAKMFSAWARHRPPRPFLPLLDDNLPLIGLLCWSATAAGCLPYN